VINRIRRSEKAVLLVPAQQRSPILKNLRSAIRYIPLVHFLEKRVIEAEKREQ